MAHFHTAGWILFHGSKVYLVWAEMGSSWILLSRLDNHFKVILRLSFGGECTGGKGGVGAKGRTQHPVASKPSWLDVLLEAGLPSHCPDLAILLASWNSLSHP